MFLIGMFSFLCTREDWWSRYRKLVSGLLPGIFFKLNFEFSFNLFVSFGRGGNLFFPSKDLRFDLGATKLLGRPTILMEPKELNVFVKFLAVVNELDAGGEISPSYTDATLDFISW
jgi:hypothetical protein